MSEYLRNKGFIHYEVSNFSLPGKEGRHNFKYWKGESVAALGPSATGFLSKGEEGIRYKWNNLTNNFSKEEITPEKFKLERLYTFFRTSLGVHPEEFFQGDELEKLEKLAEIWLERGFLKELSPRLILSPRGLLMVDSLMEDIFLNIKTF